MAETLKDENKILLYACMLFNLLVYFAIVRTDTITIGDWIIGTSNEGNFIDLAKQSLNIAPAGIGLTISGIINAFFSSNMKARIVFLRWHDPLPGSRAFSKLGPEDSRVDMNKLISRYSPLPETKHEQNVLWYKLFKTLDENPQVRNMHRWFLFARDYTCISLMFLIILGTFGFFQILTPKNAWIYLLLLFLQLLFAWFAARNYGMRLVTTVLALKGIEKDA